MDVRPPTTYLIIAHIDRFSYSKRVLKKEFFVQKGARPFAELKYSPFIFIGGMNYQFSMNCNNALALRL